MFDRSSIARKATQYVHLIAGVVAEPDRAVADLPLIGAEQRAGLLREWNPEAERAADVRSLAERFEERVANHPEAIAASCEGAALTYGELNALANQLAHRLRQLGVGPETTVGLFVERSLELVIGVLGIVKAGGAYVPVDAGYPADRVRFILDD